MIMSKPFLKTFETRRLSGYQLRLANEFRALYLTLDPYDIDSISKLISLRETALEHARKHPLVIDISKQLNNRCAFAEPKYAVVSSRGVECYHSAGGHCVETVVEWVDSLPDPVAVYLLAAVLHKGAVHLFWKDHIPYGYQWEGDGITQGNTGWGDVWCIQQTKVIEENYSVRPK